MRHQQGLLRTPLLAVVIVSVLAAGLGGAYYALRDPTAKKSAMTPRDIALRSFASVVSIAIKTPSGKPLALGSGFVVEPGVIVTNYHVIRGGGSGAVRLVGDPQWHAVEGVVGFDEAVDLVLLSVPSLKAAPLPLGDEAEVAIGDEIFAVGNPQDLEGTFSQGIVSGKRKLDEVRLLQITAPISGGSSGGPVLDGEARVVGVATSSLKDGQNLNFAITADQVSALVAAKSAPQELAKISRPETTKRAQVARSGPAAFFRRLRRLLPIP